MKNRQHQTDTFVIAHMITGKALPCKWNLKADCLCTFLFSSSSPLDPPDPPFQYAPARCQLLRKILYFSKRLISTDQPYPTPTDCILIYPTVGQKLLRFFILFSPSISSQFLVACTRLYKSLSRSVGWSVGLSVGHTVGFLMSFEHVFHKFPQVFTSFHKFF